MTLISNPEDLGADERQSLANWLTAMSDTKHLLGLRYAEWCTGCLLYTSPSPRDLSTSRMPSSA